MPDYVLQWVLIIVSALISVIAGGAVRSTYSKYSRISTAGGMTGAQAAQRILDANGIFDVKIERSQGGELSDHFDPRARVIRLSAGVYDGKSTAALGVAAHETGHAMQYAQDYMPIRIRNTILPVANIGSTVAFPLIILGILLGGSGLLVNIGIALFCVVLAFQLVTLPVEFNASHRALEALETGGIVTDSEKTGARRVLSAAAMTYVAALATSLLTLLRLLLLTQRRR